VIYLVNDATLHISAGKRKRAPIVAFRFARGERWARLMLCWGGVAQPTPNQDDPLAMRPGAPIRFAMKSVGVMLVLPARRKRLLSLSEAIQLEDRVNRETFSRVFAKAAQA
jgi:hypothetical protein